MRWEIALVILLLATIETACSASPQLLSRWPEVPANEIRGRLFRAAYNITAALPETEAQNLGSKTDPELFVGGVWDGNRLWVLPHGVINFIVAIRPKTGHVDPYPLWARVSAPSLAIKPFLGGVFDGSSVWLSPYQYDQFMRIDVNSNAVTQLAVPSAATESGVQHFFGGAAFDGTSVWFAPSSQRHIALIGSPTSSPVVSLQPQEVLRNRLDMYSGIVFDGEQMWFIPRNISFATVGGRQDPFPYGRVTPDGWFPAGTLSQKNSTVQFSGGCYDGQGHVWLAPFDAHAIIKIDVASFTATAIGGVNEDPFLLAGCAADGEWIWLVDSNASRALKVPSSGAFASPQNISLEVGNSSFTGSPPFRHGGVVFDGASMWILPSDKNTSVVRIAGVPLAPYGKPHTTSSDGISFSGFRAARPLNISDITAISIHEWAEGVPVNGDNNCFRGLVYDGTFMWLVPSSLGALIRIDPATASMKNFGSLPGVPTPQPSILFRSGVFDGTQVWLIGGGTNTTVVVSVANGAMREIAFPFPLPEEQCFHGGAFDGLNVWMSPCFGMTAPVSVRVYDEQWTEHAWSNSSYEGTWGRGCVFDGKHLWFIPFDLDLVRIHSRTGHMKIFLDWPSGVDPKMAANTPPYNGGTFDGRRVWLSPAKVSHIVTIDIKTGAISIVAEVPSLFGTAMKMKGAVFDGEHVFFVPQGVSALLYVTVENDAVGVINDFLPPSDPSELGYGWFGGTFDGSALWFAPRSCPPRPIIRLLTIPRPSSPEESSSPRELSGDGYSSSLPVRPGPITPHSAVVVHYPFPKNTLVRSASAITDGRSIWILPGQCCASGLIRLSPATGALSQFPWPAGLNLPDRPFLGGAFDGTTIHLAPLLTSIRHIYQVNAATGDITQGPEIPNAIPTSTSVLFLGAVFDLSSVWFAPSGDDVYPLLLDPVTSNFTYLQSEWPSGREPLDVRKFFGMVFDGERMWPVIQRSESVIAVHTKTFEVDTHTKIPSEWGIPVGQQFCGGAFDGTYVWFSAVNLVGFVRIHASTGTPELIKLPGGIAGVDAFRGAIFDGRYVWFPPLDHDNIVVVDSDSGEAQNFDAWPTGMVRGEKPCNGGIFDGTSVWIMPMRADGIVRIFNADPTPRHASEKVVAGDLHGQGVAVAAKPLHAVHGAMMTNWTGWEENANKFQLRGAVFTGAYVWVLPFGGRQQYAQINVRDGSTTSFRYTGSGSFFSGAFDGAVIWMCPRSGLRVPYKLNVTDGTMIAADTEGPYSIEDKGLGGVAYEPASRKVYFSPILANESLVVPVDQESTAYLVPFPTDVTLRVSQTSTAFSGIQGPLAGRMLLVPHAASHPCFMQVSAQSTRVGSFAKWPEGYTKHPRGYISGAMVHPSSWWLLPHALVGRNSGVLHIDVTTGVMTVFRVEPSAAQLGSGLDPIPQSMTSDGLFLYIPTSPRSARPIRFNTETGRFVDDMLWPETGTLPPAFTSATFDGSSIWFIPGTGMNATRFFGIPDNSGTASVSLTKSRSDSLSQSAAPSRTASVSPLSTPTSSVTGPLSASASPSLPASNSLAASPSSSVVPPPTSTASAEPTTSPASTQTLARHSPTVERSPTILPPAPAAPVTNKPQDKIEFEDEVQTPVEATTGSSVAVAASVVGSSAGLSVARARSIAQLGLCAPHNFTVEELGFLSNPLQVSWGDSATKYHAGAVWGNPIVALLIVGVHAIATFALCHIKKKSYGEAAGATRFPSNSMALALLFMQDGISSAVVILRLGSGIQQFIAVVALLVWVSSLPYLGYRLIPGYVYSKFDPRPSPWRALSWKQRILRFTLGFGIWEDTDPDNHIGFTDQWDALFVGFHAGAYWFMLVEIGLSVAFGIVMGLWPEGFSEAFMLTSCGGANYAAMLILAMSFVYLLVLLAYRPYNALIEGLATYVIAVGQLVGAGLALAGDAVSPTAANYCAMVMLSASLLQALVPMVMFVLSYFRVVESDEAIRKRRPQRKESAAFHSVEDPKKSGAAEPLLKSYDFDLPPLFGDEDTGVELEAMSATAVGDNDGGELDLDLDDLNDDPLQLEEEEIAEPEGFSPLQPANFLDDFTEEVQDEEAPILQQKATIAKFGVQKEMFDDLQRSLGGAIPGMKSQQSTRRDSSPNAPGPSFGDQHGDLL